MKSIFILVSYLFISIPLSQANLKNLATEFLQNNYGINKAESQIKLAKLGFDLTDSAYSSWLLSASTTYTDSKLELLSTLGQYSQTTSVHSLSLGKETSWGGSFSFVNAFENYDGTSNGAGFSQSLSFSQDLGKNRFGRQSKRTLELAKDDISLAQKSFQASKEEKLYLFSSTYVKASLLKSLLDYQAQAYQRSLKRKNLIRKRVKDGLREKVDLLQADNTLLQQEEELIIAENKLNDILRALSESLHRPILKAEVEYLSFSYVGLPKGQVSSNQNLAILKDKKKYVEKELLTNDNDLGAAITLNTAYKTNNYDAQASDAISDGLFGSDNNELKASLNFSWALGKEPKEASYAIKKVEDLILSKEIESQEKNLKIKNEVIVKNINNLLQIIETSKRRIDLAQKTLKEYNSLYNKGRVDLDTVIRSEEGLINVQRSYISRVSEYRDLENSLALLYGELENNIMR